MKWKEICGSVYFCGGPNQKVNCSKMKFPKTTKVGVSNKPLRVPNNETVESPRSQNTLDLIRVVLRKYKKNSKVLVECIYSK